MTQSRSCKALFKKKKVALRPMGYEPRGRGFESCQARQRNKHLGHPSGWPLCHGFSASVLQYFFTTSHSKQSFGQRAIYERTRSLFLVLRGCWLDVLRGEESPRQSSDHRNRVGNAEQPRQHAA